MIEGLFQHQQAAAEVLMKSEGFLLAFEMGTGKSRAALAAALELFKLGKIDRVLVLCPAACRYSWGEELGKLTLQQCAFTFLTYDPKKQQFFSVLRTNQGGGKLPARNQPGMPIVIVSYALLAQARHADTITKWCYGGKPVLICDESSFLKTRTAERTRGVVKVASACVYRWLLSGTPITNSPLDLWAQGEVMHPVRIRGPLHGFMNFYHFRASYGTMGGFKAKEWIANPVLLPGLQDRFKRFCWRVEKKECLDLPPKSYTVRQIPLKEETWKVYEDLRKEALLSLPPNESKPEPNAAVRIMRLAQITSGFVGGMTLDQDQAAQCFDQTNDISHEKISWFMDELTEGELSGERAMIVWCRWRRERERLAEALTKLGTVVVLQIFGGQSQKQRDEQIFTFGQNTLGHRVLIAQPHAGGYGLNLTAAHTAVYMSNDYSVTARMQSEDRTHRSGQINPCLYVDMVAVGPHGQQTIDSVILRAIKAKEEIASWTCSAWRRALE